MSFKAVGSIMIYGAFGLFLAGIYTVFMMLYTGGQKPTESRFVPWISVVNKIVTTEPVNFSVTSDKPFTFKTTDGEVLAQGIYTISPTYGPRFESGLIRLNHEAAIESSGEASLEFQFESGGEKYITVYFYSMEVGIFVGVILVLVFFGITVLRLLD